MKYYANYYKYNGGWHLCNPRKSNNKNKLFALIKEIGKAECSRGDKLYVFVAESKTGEVIFEKTYQF